MSDKVLENAKEIAELTGRTTKEVIADILDDGVLNNSIQENTVNHSSMIIGQGIEIIKLKYILNMM